MVTIETVRGDVMIDCTFEQMQAAIEDAINRNVKIGVFTEIVEVSHGCIELGIRRAVLNRKTGINIKEIIRFY
jgi:hypothetical protein